MKEVQSVIQEEPEIDPRKLGIIKKPPGILMAFKI